jgi:hypothetical protein
MTQPKAERALEAAARALWDAEWPTWPQGFAGNAENFQLKARAAVAAYLQSAPPEIRIGDFTIRHAPNGIWIGRTDGEGGEFATEQVEHAIAQFYRANF